MDVIFNCPQCDQELAIEASAAGSEIQCPSCQETIVIPEPNEENQADSAAGSEGVAGQPTLHQSPTATSAGAKVERHFKVPQREKIEEQLIEKPLATLEKSATEGIQIRIKTFRRSDCVEVGKDHFDEVVSKFLGQVGEPNIVGVHPINYSHQDLASREWVTDFGVMIIYKN